MGPGWRPAVGRRRGRKPRVPLTQVVPALTFHMLNGVGTLAEHFQQLFDARLANSSWADRRIRLPWEVFADLMRRALRPRATPRRHPTAFWRGWRLTALDGTQHSLRNTPQILAQFVKAKTRRGRAAFAKLSTVVLLELGLHNPLAAAIGRDGESEWELACTLVKQLPAGVLLLADRLYGCAAFAAQALAVCRQVGSHVLIRARMDIPIGVLKRLADGSRLITVAVHDLERPKRIVEWLELREIRVWVKRPGQRRGHELRLWTSLLNPKTAPALELARLYATRWEHELYFRELKRALRPSALLQSQTPTTVVQEVAAQVLASAVLAVERARAATSDLPALRISFVKVLAVVQRLWLFFGAFEDLLTERQKDRIVRRGYALMREAVTPKRRARSCPRKVRQPVTGWPRLLENESINGPVQLKLR